jgi:hypothetical protein
MSNTRRPSAARQHTRTSKAESAAALDQGIRIFIGDEAYEARIGDVTPGIARELRQTTGMGFMRLCQTLSVDPDIDLVCAFIWVARRIRGEYVDLESIEVDYRTLLEDFEFELAGPEKVDDADPEA